MKTELMLAKPTLIESMLTELFSRKDRMAAATHKAQAGTEAVAGDMWKQMAEAWESLTAMKIEGSTAIIPLRGTVTPDDPWSPYFGETNLALFTKNLREAADNPKVKSIVLNIYSPGGYVYGVEGAAALVYDIRQKKPVYAYTDTLAASAAYWIASAATKIFLGSETAEVGSIGVYLAHFDYSEMLKGAGIKVTEITSGEHKGIGSPYSEMTAEEKKILQADSNHVYNRFVNTVARYRSMSPQDVLKVANGLTYYGSAAVKAGLADSINSLQEVISMSTGATKVEPTESEKAAVAKAEAAEAALAAANAKNAEMAAQLVASQAAAAEIAKTALKAEAVAAYKAAFGREATADEQTAYADSNEAGRKVIAATLKEAADNRDKLAKAAGLTTETATTGVSEASDPSKSPLVMAANRLGLAK